MNQIPRFFWLNDICKRRHGRAINTGHKNFIEVLVSGTALKARTDRKIVGTNWLIVTVRQSGGGRSITASFRTMTLPTLELLKKLLTMLDALDGELWIGRYGDRVTSLVIFPARRKRLDEGHQIGALLIGKRNPGRHPWAASSRRFRHRDNRGIPSNIESKAACQSRNVQSTCRCGTPSAARERTQGAPTSSQRPGKLASISCLFCASLSP